MVHLEIDAEDLPNTYQLIGVESPDDSLMKAVEEADLPADWRMQQTITRALGDEWLANAPTSLLSVPSAIVPAGRNYLLNPTHAHAATISISSAVRAAYDPRLVAFLKR